MRPALICLGLCCLLLWSWPIESMADGAAAADDPALDRAIPYKQEEAVSTASFLKVLSIMALLLAVVAIIAYLVKKWMLDRPGSSFTQGRIKMVEMRRLNPRLSLYLVTVDGIEYLLTQSGDSCSLTRHLNEISLEAGGVDES